MRVDALPILLRATVSVEDLNEHERMRSGRSMYVLAFAAQGLPAGPERSGRS